MRFYLIIGLIVAAATVAAPRAEAQHHRAPRRPEPQVQAPAPEPQVQAPAPDPAAVAAHDQEARMLFEAGRLAYAAGRFEEALGHFQRAHEMSGRPALLFNVGSAADRMRSDAVALDAFRRYLEALPSADNRAEVEGRIHVLERAVAADQARAATTGTTDLTPALSPDGRGAGRTAREGEIGASLRVGAGGDDGQRDDRGGVFGEWWFWTIVGVVVVGGTVAAIALASSGGGFPPLQAGDDGGVHMVLRMP